MIDKRVLQLVVKEERSVDIFPLLEGRRTESEVVQVLVFRAPSQLSRYRFLPLPIMKGSQMSIP
jgi:hypothetical protein